MTEPTSPKLSDEELADYRRDMRKLARLVDVAKQWEGHAAVPAEVRKALLVMRVARWVLEPVQDQPGQRGEEAGAGEPEDYATMVERWIDSARVSVEKMYCVLSGAAKVDPERLAYDNGSLARLFLTLTEAVLGERDEHGHLLDPDGRGERFLTHAAMWSLPGLRVPECPVVQAAFRAHVAHEAQHQRVAKGETTATWRLAWKLAEACGAPMSEETFRKAITRR